MTIVAPWRSPQKSGNHSRKQLSLMPLDTLAFVPFTPFTYRWSHWVFFLQSGHDGNPNPESLFLSFLMFALSFGHDSGVRLASLSFFASLPLAVNEYIICPTLVYEVFVTLLYTMRIFQQITYFQIHNYHQLQETEN